MHELAVTQSILEIAVRHAEQAGATRVLAINLLLGRYASVVDDSVQFYWDVIAEDTIAKGAVLNFTRVPAEMTCSDCGRSFEPDETSFTCPGCGSARVRISKGEELEVQSIEVE
jgi:hydrogenase nickel incorporation protein HypA/HybF